MYVVERPDGAVAMPQVLLGTVDIGRPIEWLRAATRI